MIGKFSILTAAAVLVTTLGVHASPREHSVYLTFNQPVAIPGATLTPGTYIFEEADASSSSDVVRVLSSDRSRVFLSQFAVPVQRPKSMGDSDVVVMGESLRDEPEQIISWFVPGSDTGFAFNYDGR